MSGEGNPLRSLGRHGLPRRLGFPTAGSSLRRRVGVGGFLVLTALVLVLNLFVYVALRERLHQTLDQVLEARAHLAAELSRQVSLPALPAHLQRLGIRAEVHLQSGEQFITQPGAGQFEMLPPALETDERLVGQSVELPDGARVTVYASRQGVDETLTRVLTLQVIGTAGTLLVAAFVLGRLSNLALRPLDEVVSTARRIVAGRTDDRLGVNEDDTELSRMAGAFNEMLDALEAAAADARRSEARSRRFLADAAHQLRTPVTAMRTSVAALIREREPRERERLLDNLVRETARTSRLLEMLLRIARLDRGEHPEWAATDVGALVNEEASRTRELAPHLDVRTLFENPPADPVRVDEHGLREALANVLDNARRHARSAVEVRCAAEDGEVVITVGDDGPGLPAGAEERVFERFVSLDGDGGSGLGLPIARAVLRAHGGDATYEDGRFVLRFRYEAPPVIPAEVADEELQREEVRPGAAPPAG